MPRTDRTAPHVPDRYARRLLRILTSIDTLTAPCWIDDVLDHCADGLAFSIQLTNARNTLADLLDDLGIAADDDVPEADHRALAAAAQGELPGLDMSQHHSTPESEVGRPLQAPCEALPRPYVSRGGVSESAGDMQ